MTGRFCVRQGTAREWSGAAGCGKASTESANVRRLQRHSGRVTRTCIVKLSDGPGGVSS